MPINSNRHRAAALAAFVLAALAAGSAAYWVWHLPAGAGLTDAVVAVAGREAEPAPDAAALARLLGAAGMAAGESAAQGPAARWRLVGVVAGARGGGAALIAEDDKPARSFRVGSLVAPGLYLKSVAHRRAMLAPTLDAPVSLTLEVPLPPDPLAAMPDGPDRSAATLSGLAGRLKPAR